MSYLNPVYPANFPDPFILKAGGGFWAYGTGEWHDGRRFGILHSRDLVHWEPCAGAMVPLPGGHTCYWAPEVSYFDGRYYLYYSVGNETLMQIRVAVAERPDGPFIDSGHRVTPEDFAIDAHVAQDERGNRYLFYATDFLDHTHIGTGTVRARMADLYTLAEPAVPVTRAKYDWQVYDPNRAEKGGVRWHTVEGPFVLRRKGLYYQMFSGGNWQNPSYGVSYATSASLENREEWAQVADGEMTLPLLRTFSEQGIIGPGHNSVVRGPDNRQLYCVYHRWSEDLKERQMAIDPLDWAGERMVLSGPSATPQPAPILPTITGFDRWRFDGPGWEVDGNRGACDAWDSEASATCETGSDYFLFETLIEPDAGPPGDGSLAVELAGAGGTLLRVVMDEKRRRWFLFAGDNAFARPLPQPDASGGRVAHHLRMDVNGQFASVELDGQPIWRGWLNGSTPCVRVVITNLAARLLDPTVTAGWEELWQARGSPEWYGWRCLPAHTHKRWNVNRGQLRCKAPKEPSTIIKGEPLGAYEWVIALKLDPAAVGSGVTLAPAWTQEEPGPRLRLWRTEEGWAAGWEGAPDLPSFELPDGFDMSDFQLFRFRKQDGQLSARWESHLLAEFPVTGDPTRIAITADSTTTIDTLRLTAINDRR